MMLLFWGAIIVLIFVLACGLNPPRHNAHYPPLKTSLEILKERFARGEIDKEEFEERRNILLH
jgi:putative membrane protein